MKSVYSFSTYAMVALTAALLVSVTADTTHADDETATAAYNTAKALFEKRGNFNAADMDLALEKLTVAGDEADSDEIKYDALVLKSRVYYWKGAHKDDDASRVTLYWNGVESAEQAQSYGDFAEAPYFEAANLGRWAEAYGIVQAIVFKKAHRRMMAALDKAIAAKTRDGKAGKTYDGYGPHRAYGRLWHKLPGIYGGSRTKALVDLELAVANSNDYVLNMAYLADALFDGGSSEERTRAKTMLNEVLAKDATAFNPERVAESKEELVIAKKIRESMGN
jgi:hypothetical protein